jgi:hypothetical protein
MTRLEKIGAGLEKARVKQKEWMALVKNLEERYREEENAVIHDMVHEGAGKGKERRNR